MRSRQADELVGDGEDDARRAERDEAGAGLRRADPDGRCGIVAAAPCDRDLSSLESPRLGDGRGELAETSEPSTSFGIAASVRPVAAIRSPSQARRPTSSHERSRGVRHFRDSLARQPQAHVVLGQQHSPGRLGDRRLVSRDPQHLGRGEAGHHQIAGALLDIGDAALELGAFGEGPAVVPQDRRPERLVVGAEQGRAVHLAGKADPGERGELGRRVRGGWPRPKPPRPRPSRPGSARSTRAAGGDTLSGARRLRHDALVAVDQQRLDRRRANVEPEIGLMSLRHGGLPAFRPPLEWIAVRWNRF